MAIKNCYKCKHIIPDTGNDALCTKKNKRTSGAAPACSEYKEISNMVDREKNRKSCGLSTRYI